MVHLLLMTAALVVLVPQAAAFTLTADGPETPIEPATAVHVPLVATIPCTILPETATALRVHWQGESEEAGLTLTLPGPSDLDPLDCRGPDAMLVVTANATVTADPSVPSDRPHAVLWTAVLEGNGEVASATTDLLVAHTGGIEVHAQATLKKGAPQKQLRYPIELRNLANGPTAVTFRLDGEHHGFPVLPEPVVLARAGEPGDATTVEVLYATPYENGPNDAEETLAVQVIPSTVDGTPLEAPHEVVLTAQTEGLYVPGPGAVPLLLLGLAWVVLRRSQGPLL